MKCSNKDLGETLHLQVAPLECYDQFGFQYDSIGSKNPQNMQGYACKSSTLNAIPLKLSHMNRLEHA